MRLLTVGHLLMLSHLSFTDVSELKDLVNTAEQSQFPDCDLFQQLKAAVAEAERCASVALQLVSRKHRTRYSRQSWLSEMIISTTKYSVLLHEHNNSAAAEQLLFYWLCFSISSTVSSARPSCTE